MEIDEGMVVTTLEDTFGATQVGTMFIFPVGVNLWDIMVAVFPVPRLSWTTSAP